MRLKNTLGLAIGVLINPQQAFQPTLVHFIQSRLIVSGWVVWNGGFDYRSQRNREMISPNRELINKALENHHENGTGNSNTDS